VGSRQSVSHREEELPVSDGVWGSGFVSCEEMNRRSEERRGEVVNHRIERRGEERREERRSSNRKGKSEGEKREGHVVTWHQKSIMQIRIWCCAA
jgi:hypothetical protein